MKRAFQYIKYMKYFKYLIPMVLLSNLAFSHDCKFLARLNDKTDRICCKTDEKIEKECFKTNESCRINNFVGIVYHCNSNVKLLENNLNKINTKIEEFECAEIPEKGSDTSAKCEKSGNTTKEEQVTYSLRPDILSLEGKPCNKITENLIAPDEFIEYYRNLPGFDAKTKTLRFEKCPAWEDLSLSFIEKLKLGYLEAIAEILGLYPGYEIYVMGRDGEPIYDFARVLTNQTHDQSRIHLLLSSSKILKDPNYKKYIEEQGISESTLQNGKKILFVDIGYAGNASEYIENLFPPQFKSNFRSHFLASVNPNIPSTRLFLEVIGRNTPEISRTHLVTDLEGLPMYFNAGNKIHFINGKWEGTCPTEKEDYSDPKKANKELALERMRDIKDYASSPNNMEHFQSRMKLFEKLYNLSKSHQTEALNQELSILKKEEPNIGSAIEQDLGQVMKSLTK